MLREIVREVQRNIPNILNEILVRILLLMTVCLMCANLQPYTQHLTETELLHEYKKPRKDSIIPPWIVVVLVIFVPLLTVTVPCVYTKSYTDTAQALLAWTLGCAINAFLTETGKLMIGRPRPDFFLRCFPNGGISKNLTCTGNLKDVMDGRKSFPSGHSSFSFCSLGFVSVWLCGKLGVLSMERGSGARVLACLAPLFIAGVVAMSRFCDHHHHWEDVIAGSVIGFASSYFCYRQYFYPLDSDQSGQTYISVMKRASSECDSEIECCTKDLNTYRKCE